MFLIFENKKNFSQKKNYMKKIFKKRKNTKDNN